MSKNRFVPLQFLSDGLFSLIKKENIKEFGIDENTDLERSLTDSVGYNEAMRVLKEKERDANTCRAAESQEDTQARQDEDVENPIMRYITKSSLSSKDILPKRIMRRF